jgi:hypothetical protein
MVQGLLLHSTGPIWQPEGGLLLLLLMMLGVDWSPGQLHSCCDLSSTVSCALDCKPTKVCRSWLGHVESVADAAMSVGDAAVILAMVNDLDPTKMTGVQLTVTRQAVVMKQLVILK